MAGKNLTELDKQADDIIMQTAGTLGAAGIVNPFPLVGDPPIIIAGWTSMLARLANCYDIPFSEEACLITIREAIRSCAFYFFGTYALITVSKLTGFGTVPAAIANGLLNAAFTYAVGQQYKQAWREGRQPSASDLSEALKRAAKEHKP